MFIHIILYLFICILYIGELPNINDIIRVTEIKGPVPNNLFSTQNIDYKVVKINPDKREIILEILLENLPENLKLLPLVNLNNIEYTIKDEHSTSGGKKKI